MVSTKSSTAPICPGLEMVKPYKRVVLEYTGEMFRGEREHGIDLEFLTNRVVDKIREAVEKTEVEMLIVPGGGNFMRETTLARHGARRVTADRAEYKKLK